MRGVMKKGRILLVDEDQLFRLRLKYLLEQEEGMEIVGDCASAEEALSQAEILSPNIVLMDTWLPGMNGIEACRHLTGNGRDCDVIMLTTGQELINDALKSGAAGYFPKELRYEELVTAIKLTCKRQSLMAGSDASSYSIRQIETMIMGNLVSFTVEQAHEEGEPECLSPEGNGANLVQEVTLVIPLPGDIAQLRRFICQVEATLQSSLLETVGSWNNTHITLRLQRPVSPADILDKLRKMPEVAEVEEKAPVRAGRFSFFKKSEAPSRKMISVTLDEQFQPLTAAEQVPQYLEPLKLQPQPVGAMVI